MENNSYPISHRQQKQNIPTKMKQQFIHTPLDIYSACLVPKFIKSPSQIQKSISFPPNIDRLLDKLEILILIETSKLQILNQKLDKLTSALENIQVHCYEVLI
ncbi:hypothetical protein SS50377_23870 [Spironucleus salmonicida]|uniref:Uncharacterized protein n=1 Tax=Spironucleus salmonicida TaxID=348837 RepID=A0A9P8RYL6_9EUKA|nr:hypothetical protein SS50377_23870 [Spironucleus salmonicida]